MKNYANKKVRVVEVIKGYQAVFAVETINPNEIIDKFDGEKRKAENVMALENDFGRHAIQIGPNTWQDGRSHKDGGIARYLNHSCKPNCYMEGSNTLRAIKTIKPEEELLWDYATTEDDRLCPLVDMPCLCGSSRCRGEIGIFSTLPARFKNEYVKKEFVASWLVKKYGFDKKS